MTTRAERLAAGTILLHEERMRRAMAGAVKDTVAAAATSMQRGRRGEPLRRAAQMVAIVIASRAMSTALYPHIVTARAATRAASRRRLTIELAAAGVTGYAIGAAYDSDEDHARATLAADGLAVGWRAVALAMLLQASRKKTEPGAAIEKSARLMAPRVSRTAATETATAYNAERLTALRDERQSNKSFAEAVDSERVVRQWSAFADACERCWPLNGSLSTIDGDFDSGYEPGDVHVHCRCAFTVVSVTAEEYAEAA